MAKRLKSKFPKLPLNLLLDGLYAKGPIMEICRKNKWGFMIVLKDKSLSTVWKEVTGLLRLVCPFADASNMLKRFRKEVLLGMNQ